MLMFVIDNATSFLCVVCVCVVGSVRVRFTLCVLFFFVHLYVCE